MGSPDRELSLLKIEKVSFWITYWGLVTAIVVQMLMYREDAIRYVAGAIASGVIFFINIVVLCYIVLTVMMLVYKKRKAKLDNELED